MSEVAFHWYHIKSMDTVGAYSLRTTSIKSVELHLDFISVTFHGDKIILTLLIDGFMILAKVLPEYVKLL